MRKVNFSKNRGFSLIEILLVIGIMFAMMLFKVQEINDSNMTNLSNVFSDQLKTVSNAVNAYINLNYANLSTMTSIPDGQQYGPLNCNSNTNNCTITIETLKDAYLLNHNFNEQSILGNGYSIQLNRAGVSPNFMISGLVISNGENQRTGEVDNVFIGNVIKDIGADGGLMKNKGVMSGIYSGWNTNSLTYDMLNDKKDYVGVQVGYSANMYSIYLRRDGTLPMTGALNMDGHNINNIQDFNAYGNGVINGTLNVDKDSTIGGNEKVKGNISSDKNISAQGNVTAGNWLVAHNGGGNTMYIGGDSAPHADGSLANDYEIKMDTAKPLTIWNTAMSSDRSKTLLEVWGSQKVLGNLTVSSANTANGDISASGNIKSNSTVSGNYLKVNSVSQVGATCSEQGLISKDANGKVLSCVNGKWAGINSRSTQIFSGGGGKIRLATYENHICSILSWRKYAKSRTGAFYFTKENGYWYVQNNGEYIEVMCVEN